MKFYRKLEEIQFLYIKGEATGDDVIEELSKFQNEDGGFGHGIEPDYLLPDSSPMATSIGMRILHQLKKSEMKQTVMDKAIDYLMNTYDSNRNGWYSVPQTVNNFPHAPWWHWDNQSQMTLIDQHWGNPTAEIIGYLSYYRKSDMTEKLVYSAIKYFNQLKTFDSEHEIYCYLRFYDCLTKKNQAMLFYSLKRAVHETLREDSKTWYEYVPKPYDFLKCSKDNWYEISEQALQEHAKFMKSEITAKGYIDVTWNWGMYEDHWLISKEIWRGILTLEAVKNIGYDF